jgi:hypothetical protein
MLRHVLRIALKIFLWREVVATTLLMVTSADIIRKRDLFLDVNVSRETAFLVTGGASMAASNSTIGLENKSVFTHSSIKILVALSALFAFWCVENAESAENAGG